MVPLNIWLEQVEGQQLRDAIEEYGNAIRQLAAANIFPGDMLFKNFGVTRHGRVVFYDYDEICYMTEVNFRDIPPPRYPEDELASEPWYSVSPTCSALITGAHYKTAYVKGMWKMFMRIGAGKDLAYGMGRCFFE